jgi:hypothetical protein
MNRKQALLMLAAYLVGTVVCTQWALALGNTGLLGLVLWTSFFGFGSAVGWAVYWSREHWMG